MGFFKVSDDPEIGKSKKAPAPWNYINCISLSDSFIDFQEYF